MLRISEFAKAGNVTVRALHFYDEMGLLRPAHVSPETGYRRYTPAQLVELNRIQSFKDMGFALDEILDLLRHPPGSVELRRILLERREELRTRVREDAGRLARIEARLGSLEAAGKPDSLVLFGETRPQWVASVREKLNSYDEADSLLADLERRIDPPLLTDGRAAIWHSCTEAGGSIDCEAVCFLKRPVPANRKLKVYELPPARIAFAYHYGAEDSICRTYESIASSLTQRGYRVSGPKREVYWPAGSSGKLSFTTEVQFPIANQRMVPRAGPANSA